MMGNWFQDSPWIPQSLDVLALILNSTLYTRHTMHSFHYYNVNATE